MEFSAFYGNLPESPPVKTLAVTHPVAMPPLGHYENDPDDMFEWLLDSAHVGLFRYACGVDGIGRASPCATKIACQLLPPDDGKELGAEYKVRLVHYKRKTRVASALTDKGGAEFVFDAERPLLFPRDYYLAVSIPYDDYAQMSADGYRFKIVVDYLDLDTRALAAMNGNYLWKMEVAGGRYYVSDGYDSAPMKLDVEIDAVFGDIDVVWLDGRGR